MVSRYCDILMNLKLSAESKMKRIFVIKTNKESRGKPFTLRHAYSHDKLDLGAFQDYHYQNQVKKMPHSMTVLSSRPPE